MYIYISGLAVQRLQSSFTLSQTGLASSFTLSETGLASSFTFSETGLASSFTFSGGSKFGVQMYPRAGIFDQMLGGFFAYFGPKMTLFVP